MIKSSISNDNQVINVEVITISTHIRLERYLEVAPHCIAGDIDVSVVIVAVILPIVDCQYGVPTSIVHTYIGVFASFEAGGFPIELEASVCHAGHIDLASDEGIVAAQSRWKEPSCRAATGGNVGSA